MILVIVDPRNGHELFWVQTLEEAKETFEENRGGRGEDVLQGGIVFSSDFEVDVSEVALISYDGRVWDARWNSDSEAQEEITDEEVLRSRVFAKEVRAGENALLREEVAEEIGLDTNAVLVTDGRVTGPFCVETASGEKREGIGEEDLVAIPRKQAYMEALRHTMRKHPLPQPCHVIHAE